MPGLTTEWPPWKEYVLDKKVAEVYDADGDYAAAKKAIIEEYGEEALRKSWVKTCAALEKVTAELEEKGNEVIPILSIQDVLSDSVSEETKTEIRRVGCFVVRGVIPKPSVDAQFANLKAFVATNKSLIKGWPDNPPSILNLYNSTPQNALRTHPQQIALMRWINNLWHWTPDPDVSADPLLYVDGVRIRPPKSQFLGLGPHVDAGSLCRWADPDYRRAYGKVFGGLPEEHDCYDLDARKDANQMLYPGDGQSTVLRAFQGWTALTRTAPREGTIRLFPNVKWQIAYVLLRPFFSPPADSAKVMDAEAWTFGGDGNWFPGTFKNDSQYLSSGSHPHLRLKETLLHAPAMEAGDTVWWHADMCHAVDAEHIGTEDASVTYIAATPTTRINKEYMQRQYAKMAKGMPPPDFEHGGSDETKLEGFEGFAINPQLMKELMASV
ncbi:DUF1479-domain-containing protein [Mytilinidion resinicola]|uniref:DUF1479-domain-containing protein n=1 Tax=Mytilinidion resinicola TaxID=574789 RepID=A0A6A6YA75_9PEZI|nr:DUF1479-domain-containing protein [Mytilinidion resinicola]KAF2805433.1 DUF1479-domain-containing protein [Mytilinidion resinicola]